MGVERFNPPSLARPSGFSHAVAATGERLVFLAGQTGTDQQGKIVAGDVVAQFEQALGNLLTALAAAGGTAADRPGSPSTSSTSTTTARSSQIGAVWRRLAGAEYPAVAAVGVTRLWDPAATVEIQGVAVTSGLPRCETG